MEVEKLLKVEQDAFEMIDKLSKKLAEAEKLWPTPRVRWT